MGQAIPIIRYIEPEEGFTGQAVTLIGENFRDNLQVMFGSSVAHNTKLISPNAMRVIVPPRSSLGLVDVLLGCKENNRSFCKISASSVPFRYSSPNELESNFSRLQELICRISKDTVKLSKEMMLRKANDILEKICQHAIFQQIGLQALTESTVADLASSALTSVNSSTNSTGSTSSLNSNGSVSSISSRMNLNASLPSNLNNLISNTNMMMNNVHNNQLGHHLSNASSGSPVSNSSASQLNLMASNLTNNLSTNSNSNSSSGSNNGTPTQMINSINHNSINHTALKYENAYQNNVGSSSSANHMMNSSARNVSHHHTSSYITSPNIQSATSGLFPGYMNPFLGQAVNQSYQLAQFQ